MPSSLKLKLRSFFCADSHIAPLAVLRMAFGVIMLISTVRFLLKGWVYEFYIKPKYHFTFYGFGWVKPLGSIGMYALFALLVLAAIMVTIGLFYRGAIIVFFTCFTYVELIDKTYYLNHYYFISVMAFLLVWVPAGRYFSLDVLRKPTIKITHVPAFIINIFKLQLLLVYLFAGVSKLNTDWLIQALPLRIWLPASSHLPVIGGLLTQLWVAYMFSWFGAVFDLFIGFLLLISKTRKPAYLMVIIFHLATAWFFKIGMFPYIMIFVAIIFFPVNTHQKIIAFFKAIFFNKKPEKTSQKLPYVTHKLIFYVLYLHFLVQIILPFRFLLYPGKLYWTEEGYRFSWRVMLMEKGGTAFFHIIDPQTGQQAEVDNSRYLTRLQESMMASQPDMILQYAHILYVAYQKKGIKNPVVKAEDYVTLNGGGSRLFIDSSVNLANEHENLCHKNWIIPFNNNQK